MPFVLEITHQAQNQGVQITLINKRPNHDWRETVSTDGGLKGSKRANAVELSIVSWSGIA